MKTSREIYDRIRWDRRFDPGRVTIGWRERGRKELRQTAFESWDGSIPWHRVRTFSLDGKVIWDRDKGLDRISSGEALLEEARASRTTFRWREGWKPAEAGELGLPLRVVTWNVLSDRHHHAITRLDRRLAAILAALRAADADVIALQEVTRPFLEALLEESWVRDAYSVSDATGETLQPEGVLLLARVPFEATEHVFANSKRLLVGRLRVAGRPLSVAVLHATSDHARDAARKRAHELETLLAMLGTDEALVCGDLNARREDPGGLAGHGFADAWRTVHGSSSGPTFDPIGNDLARRTSVTGLPGRFDRVLVRARDLEARAARRFGNEERALSDHDALAVEVGPLETLDREPSTRAALAVLVPPLDAIEALRRRHDPAFERWPPHLNVVFPFVEGGGDLVARAVAGLGPVPVELAKFIVLEHAREATLALAADGPLAPIHAACARRLPRCARESWTPHVTVGRFASAGEARAFAEKLAWKPVRFEVRALSILRRDGDRFEVRETVPLGATLEAWLATRLESGREKQRKGEVVARLRDLLGRLEVVGSTALGVALPGSDLDVVVDRELSEVAALLERNGIPTRLASDARVPVVRLVLGEVRVDIQREPEAVARVRRYLGIPHFATVLGAVRVWTRARRIDAQAWGFPGGAVWAEVVAAALGEGSPEEQLAAVFESVTEVETPAAATRAIVQGELARARELAQYALAGVVSWDELAVPAEPSGSLLRLSVEGPPEARGFLEKNAVALVRALGPRVRPFPDLGAIAFEGTLDPGPLERLSKALADIVPGARLIWKIERA